MRQLTLCLQSAQKIVFHKTDVFVVGLVTAKKKLKILNYIL